MPGSTVAIGMSGGVDSTVAACLLREQGYAVIGVTFDLCPAHVTDPDSTDRPWSGQALAARAACDRLGIEHHLVDAVSPFQAEVVEPFVEQYRSGRTPNPCIVCNERVKFPLLGLFAERHGCERIATGHYARLVADAGARPRLARGSDHRKDQSYFLYRVPVHLLRKTLFPVGGLHKADVRARARNLGLGNADATESQDTCFLAGGGLHGFLSRRGVDKPGKVLGPEGEDMGRHKGVSYYTVGQRKGLGIAGGRPLYVRSIDAARNVVELAPDERLYASRIVCRSLRLRTRRLEGPLTGKIRHGHRPAPIRSVEIGSGSILVSFVSPQRAATPGQSLVIYRGETVMGGGFIEEALP